MNQLNKILELDVLAADWPIDDGSVNCIVTSPPYWALKDYGVNGQIGMEKTPEEYISKLVLVFRQAWRVLRDDGTLWINIGDSYAHGPKKKTAEQACRSSRLNGGVANQIACKDQPNKLTGDLKAKDMVGIPWMLAFALRADGWYLRQDIIWSKPNPMPESVTDRCTKSHEYLFMLSKSGKYYYDYEAIKTEAKDPADDVRRITKATVNGKSTPEALRNGIRKSDKQRGHSRRHAGFNDRWDNMTVAEQMANGANKRSVWQVPTKPFPEAHFATFPPELIIDCIKAGSPVGGTVIDPFMGSGTTAMVAKKLERNFIGFELNPAYIEIANNRLRKEIGMFL